LKWKRSALPCIAVSAMLTLLFAGCAGNRADPASRQEAESPAQQPASPPEPESNPEQRLFERARTSFAILPEEMPGAEQDSPAMVRLGEALFFSPEISSERRSCNNCHPVDFRRGGADNLPVPTRRETITGLLNAPTVLNAGFQSGLFQDGRNGVIDAPEVPEVENFHLSLSIEPLEENKLYSWAIRRAFPEAENPFSRENAIQAIGAYLRTLTTHDRFDLYLQGQQEVLTKNEKEGLRIFIERKCVQCHDGPLLGGTFRSASEGEVNEGNNKPGKGSGQKTLRGPQLRNILLTAPYFYDGKVPTLPEAIERMGDRQLHIELSGEEILAILQFLTTLSDIERTSTAPPDKTRETARNQSAPPIAGVRSSDLRAWPAEGERIYRVRCQGCHASDGGGYRSSGDMGPGRRIVAPLRGPESYENGSPMHQISFAADFIRSNMPLGTPRQRPALTEEEALDVAAYINSFPHPERKRVEKDYTDMALKPATGPSRPVPMVFFGSNTSTASSTLSPQGGPESRERMPLHAR